MELLQINGGKSLFGEVAVHGAKNSVLPILAGCVLVKGISVIHNCPHLTDVDVTVNILKHLGAKVEWQNNTLIVDTTCFSCSDIPEDLMQEMRSSIIFLGSLSSRIGCASMFLPGGCDIGLRPIDLHLQGLKSLGYDILFNGDTIISKKGNLKPSKIVLSFPSVGATENIILASIFIKGKTTIVNSAREPEIVDLVNFLNSAGAKIKGASTPVIEIEGVDCLHSTEHTVIPDRILVATLMSAVSATKGDAYIKNVKLNHLMPIIPVFEEMGCKLYVGKTYLRIKAPKRLKRVKKIQTLPYPGFPTDCQSPVMSALTIAKGTSIIEEKIFEGRFKNVPNLIRFGADIAVIDRTAIITGVKQLHPANVSCTDLRGGAAVVIEALASDGVSNIKNIHHIDRGYEKIENIFSSLGADIKRINNEEKEITKS